jgi:threonylcarbamoyladenosine tRNA methylthiotransferase MtaB
MAANSGADLISGTTDRRMFALKAEELYLSKDRSPHSTVASVSGQKFEELPPGSAHGRTRALLKIQDGCDNFCTYCIVPYVRGRSRSLPLAKASQYARELEKKGYREIIITGIEISSYGKDFIKQESPVSILNAIQAISSAAPKTRLRLGSLDPSIMTDALCKKLSEIPNLCNHFHLSLQSGCDETLRRMGRKYTSSEVQKSIESIRNHFKDPAITADLITGFPGETKDEFDQTMKFIKNAAFSDMHTFPYSQRPGTKASKMPEQQENDVKKKRAQEATEVANENAEKFKHSQIGKITGVLFEKQKNDLSTGHSSNYLEISVKEKIKQNTIKSVRISTVLNGAVYGEIV